MLPQARSPVETSRGRPRPSAEGAPAAASPRRLSSPIGRRLKRHSTADRRVLVEDGQDYQSWALCEKVAAESRAAAASDPREALGLAELAVHIAERIPGETAWRRKVKELLGPAVVARIEAG